MKDKAQKESEGVKTYDEKVSDYKEHFDDVGMHDPSTEAAIKQMETATPRAKADEEAHELVERREAREAKNLENGGERSVVNFPSEQKKMNESLSGVVTDRKEHDEEEQKMTETGEKSNIDRGGSEEAETGISNPKAAKAAVNAAKKDK